MLKTRVATRLNFSRDQSEDFDEIMRRYSDFVESSEDEDNDVDDVENGR